MAKKTGLAKTIDRAVDGSSPGRAEKDLPAIAMLKQYEDRLMRVLPQNMDPARLYQILTTQITRNKQLAQCAPVTIAGAAFQCALMGMEPGGHLGQCYLIPYYNTKNGRYEAQFQLGYKGMVALSYRSGDVASVRTSVIFANDTYEIHEGTEGAILHRPKLDGDRGEPLIYYAVITTINGGRFFEWMTIPEIEFHRDRFSKAHGKGGFNPWRDNFDAMARKTVLIRALKVAPLSIEAQRHVGTDGTVVRDIPEKVSFDTIEAEAEYVDVDDAGEPPPDTEPAYEPGSVEERLDQEGETA